VGGLEVYNCKHVQLGIVDGLLEAEIGMFDEFWCYIRQVKLDLQYWLKLGTFGILCFAILKLGCKLEMWMARLDAPVRRKDERQ
jgi:hypothetical protein